MKKHIISFLYILACMVLLTSCLEEYLDKAPESSLTMEDVFTKYENFKKYFDEIYRNTSNKFDVTLQTTFPIWLARQDSKVTWDSFTDMCDLGRPGIGVIKGGNMGYGGGGWYITPYPSFYCIRIANTALQNIEMLKDARQDDKDDLIAQAHFVRAYAHFNLIRNFGAMPYLTKRIGATDSWDIPQIPTYDGLLKIAADMDTAASFYEKAGRMRRDPLPNLPGHLNHPDQFRPNGVAAKAFKARALLYAASPLNNKLGTAKPWEDAAKANWEAIKIAEQYGYDLLLAADYKLNFVGARYSNEQLWGYYAGDVKGCDALFTGVLFNSKTYASGECPTQNFVDKFETKWGEPLVTDADRQAAIAAGHYIEQDPYSPVSRNLDPRFYIDIIYNEAPIPDYGTCQIWYQPVPGKPTIYSEFQDQSYNGITRTGYLHRKFWGGQSVKNSSQPPMTDPLIRLAELYLNYAEAANEAYGPNTAAPGATMTAVQAINKIRTRIGMPEVQSAFTADKDLFRQRIKNERIIELCLEGHYYHDIRRWKDAPVTMAGPLYGMDIEKLTAGYDPAIYPRGYRYTRKPLSEDRQCHWKDPMYFFTLNLEEYYKLKNYIPNEPW